MAAEEEAAVSPRYGMTPMAGRLLHVCLPGSASSASTTLNVQTVHQNLN